MALRAVIAAALVLVVPASARAASIPVTTGSDGIVDDGQCTLREAVNSANNDIAVGGCPARDTIATGDLDIFGALTVRGAGAGQTTVDGGRKDRVFDVAVNATATISNLTVTHGEVPAAGAGSSIFGEFGDSVSAGPGFPSVLSDPGSANGERRAEPPRREGRRLPAAFRDGCRPAARVPRVEPAPVDQVGG
jgi:CSLREA domain-containing protein